MVDLEAHITETRLRLAEFIAALPTLVGWFFLLALLTPPDGQQGAGLTAIAVWGGFAGYGLVLVGVVAVSNIYRYTRKRMKISKLSVSIAVLYIVGWLISLGTFYISDITGLEIDSGILEPLFVGGMLIPTAAAAVLSIVIFGRGVSTVVGEILDLVKN